MNIFVIDPQSVCIDKIQAQVGMKVKYSIFTGKIIKVNEKSVLVQDDLIEGNESTGYITRLTTPANITQTEAKKFGWKPTKKG